VISLSASALGLLVWAAPAGPAAPEEPPVPVAIVTRLRGTASLAGSPSGRTSLSLFQRLNAGGQLEVGPDSDLVVVFGNGRRYLLGHGAVALLGREELFGRRGPVTALSPLPPLPTLARIRADERAGSRAAAVRIRGERIDGLHPRSGESAPVSGAVLRFERVSGAARYRVEVRDEAGGLWQLTTAETRVAVPPGLLKPEARYSWTVRTVDRAGPMAGGEADFVTLSAALEAQRAALKEALEGMGDASSLALLAEVDRGLGLVAEASEEAKLALRGAGDDTTLRDALQAFKDETGERGHR